MIETIIRYIVIAIVLGVIGEVISHLSSSKTTDENISTTHYRQYEMTRRKQKSNSP